MSVNCIARLEHMGKDCQFVTVLMMSAFVGHHGTSTRMRIQQAGDRKMVLHLVHRLVSSATPCAMCTMLGDGRCDLLEEESQTVSHDGAKNA